MTTETTPPADQVQIPPPHERTRKVDIADLIGWSGKNVLFPLVPFLVGAVIRSLENLEISLESLDSAELAFSLALFCLLGYVSAHHLDQPGPRDSISVLFGSGSIIFLSMFAYAVSQSAQLINLEEKALFDIVNIVKSGNPPDPLQIQSLAEQQVFLDIKSRLDFILIIVAMVGLIYLILGLRFRHTYKIGDE